MRLKPNRFANGEMFFSEGRYLRVNPAKGIEAFTLKEALDASLATNPTRGDLKKFAWWRSL